MSFGAISSGLRPSPVTLADLDSAPRSSDEASEPAIDLRGLERVLTAASPTAERFRRHPEIEGAYLLRLTGREVAVTFRPSVLDEHVSRLRLLTYLSSELDELLELARLGELRKLDATARFVTDGGAVSSLREFEGLREST